MASEGFECNICLDVCREPVVTVCGHLFCWVCLYQWIEQQAQNRCPVCKAGVNKDNVIPVYGRGKAQIDPRTQVPSRPAGQRPEPRPHPPSAMPFGVSMPDGGYSFSAGFGVPSLFGLHFQSLFGGEPPRPDRQPLPPEVIAERQQRRLLEFLLVGIGLFVLAALLS